MQFTQEQKRIIEHPRGHARVRAVAGSGKTTTMVERIAHLLEQGVDSTAIMVLMFNKSARDAFEEKLRARLQKGTLQAPEIRTFHSLGLRLVESFVRRGALEPMRLVTEEHVREALARKIGQHILKEVDDGWSLKEDLEEFLSFIDLVKASRETPQQLARDISLPSRFSSFVEGYNLFEEERQEKKIRFYSDLIVDPLIRLEGDEELQAWVSNRVDYIIVDEYQDINECQQELLKTVAGSRAQVMVVGDGDQCIYEWRGAKPEYISSRFGEDFRQPVDYSLSVTFRYGDGLCLAANHLIANNIDESRSMCRAHVSNPCTQITTHETTKGKKNPVVEIVKDWQLQGRKLTEMVVLVRLYAMSVPVELAFLEEGIPYRLQGGRTVFNCPEILALTGYLRLCAGNITENGREHTLRLVQEMLAQPHTGVKKAAQEHLASSIATSPESASSIILSQIKSSTKGFHRKKLEKLADTWQWLLDEPGSAKAHKVLKRLVARLDLYQFYYDFSTRESSAENRIQTCESLISFAAEQDMSVEDFVAELHRLQYQENIEEERVLITSIHRAKGLEWPLVVLPGLVEGSFPFTRTSGKEDGPVGEGVEDERRLFYVAMTRAIEQLHILHPVDFFFQESMVDGRAGVLPGNERPLASCFLYEANLQLSSEVGACIHNKKEITELLAVDPDMVNSYLESQEIDLGKVGQSLKPKGRQKITAVEKVALSTSVLATGRVRGNDAVVGLQVIHERFGKGLITKVADKKLGKVTVDFENEESPMVLLLNYAKVFCA